MKKLLLLTVTTLSLTACMTTDGTQHRANVYKSHQVNQEQEVKTINIIAINPIRIEVDNTSNRESAQLAGGLLGAIAGGLIGASADNNANEKALIGGGAGGLAGAAAGSLVPQNALVDGVSITYEHNGKILNSSQIGELCEYRHGTAILIATHSKETRVQPNNTCN